MTVIAEGPLKEQKWMKMVRFRYGLKPVLNKNRFSVPNPSHPILVGADRLWIFAVRFMLHIYFIEMHSRAAVRFFFLIGYILSGICRMH